MLQIHAPEIFTLLLKAYAVVLLSAQQVSLPHYLKPIVHQVNHAYEMQRLTIAISFLERLGHGSKSNCQR